MEVTVERIVAGGVGLGRWQGMAVLVPFSAPGDLLRIEVRQRGNRFLRGEILEILEPGAGRRAPLCPWYGRCGGCDLQHLTDEAALQAKSAILEDALARIGGIREAGILAPALAAQQTLGYRRRVGFKVRRLGNRVLMGFFERESHRIVDLAGCPAIHPDLSRLLAPLRLLIAALDGGGGLPQVDAVRGEEGCGLIFHLLHPLSRRDGQRLEGFAREQGIGQIWVQYGRKTGLVPLWQTSPLSCLVPPFRLAFHPADFVQAHFQQNRLLVQEAMACCGQGARALDLFCGVGNFTLFLAGGFGEVLGVEGYAPALQRAADNATDNGVTGVSFRPLDLASTDGVAALPQSGLATVLLDPPREGAVAVCRWLAGGEVPRVVYVSCDPPSLARDTAILQHGGYRLLKATAVDMFPQTHHVETVALFER